MKRLEAINKLGAFTLDNFEVMTPGNNTISGFIVTAKMKNVGDLLITNVNNTQCDLHIKSHGYFAHPRESTKTKSLKLKLFDSFGSKPLTFYPLLIHDRIVEVGIKDSYGATISTEDFKSISQLKGFNNLIKLVKEKKCNILAFPRRTRIYVMLMSDSEGFYKEDEIQSTIKSAFLDYLPELFHVKHGFSTHFTAIPTKHASKTYGLTEEINFMNFYDLFAKLEEIIDDIECYPLVLDSESMMIYKPNPVFDEPIITEDDIYKATKVADSMTEGLNFNDRYETVIKILQESFSEAMVGALLDQILTMLKEQYVQNGGYTYMHKIANAYHKKGLKPKDAITEFCEKHQKMSLLKDEFKEVYEDAHKKELDAST